MKILNRIVEIITSPITFLLKNSLGIPNVNKWAKPLFILLFSAIVVVVLVLIGYRQQLFG